MSQMYRMPLMSGLDGSEVARLASILPIRHLSYHRIRFISSMLTVSLLR